MIIRAEMTDTFGGEANYSWVKRVEFDAPEGLSTRAIVRRVKQALGVHGRHVTENWGESLAIRPVGVCAIAFVTFDY